MNTSPKSVSELYPPKWVRVEDLQGRPATVIIAAVSVEDLRSFGSTDREPRAILSFEGKTRRLILNQTQCKQVAQALGSEAFADWVGKRLQLIPTIAPNKKPTIGILPAPQGNGRPVELARPGVGA